MRHILLLELESIGMYLVYSIIKWLHLKQSLPNAVTQVCVTESPWWRHQMETFSALLALCAGNSPVIGEFPTQRPVTRSFDVSFNLRLNKRLSTQSWGRWFETPSYSIWRHRNVNELMAPTGWSLFCLTKVNWNSVMDHYYINSILWDTTGNG